MIDNPVRRVRTALNLSQFGMARKLRTTFLVLSDCEHSGTLPRNPETVIYLRELARQAGIDLEEAPASQEESLPQEEPVLQEEPQG